MLLYYHMFIFIMLPCCYDITKLIYAWLFKKNKKVLDRPIQAGVINLRAKNFDFQKCIVNKIQEFDNSIFQSLEDTLGQFFLELFDPNQDFDHKNIDDQCRFCD